jgi:hypothetical protein
MPMSTTNDTLNKESPSPRTLVSIRRGWWKGVAGLAAIWLFLMFGSLRSLDVRSALFWLDLVCAIGLLALALPYLLGRARLPVFAVREDGVQIPAYQHFQGARPSMRNWRDLGLFTWDQIGECRWSQYNPGVLVVRVVVSQADGKPKNSPGRLECRIPEPDRLPVQEAIRSMGKWAD